MVQKPAAWQRPVVFQTWKPHSASDLQASPTNVDGGGGAELPLSFGKVLRSSTLVNVYPSAFRASMMPSSASAVLRWMSWKSRTPPSLARTCDMT
jgi:hypothetical protein